MRKGGVRPLARSSLFCGCENPKREFRFQLSATSFFYCAIDRMSGGLSQSCSVTMRLLLASGFLALVLLGQCKGISDHDTAMQKWCVRKKTILMDTTKYIFIHSSLNGLSKGEVRSLRRCLHILDCNVKGRAEDAGNENADQGTMHTWIEFNR